MHISSIGSKREFDTMIPARGPQGPDVLTLISIGIGNVLSFISLLEADLKVIRCSTAAFNSDKISKYLQERVQPSSSCCEEKECFTSVELHE